MATKFTLEDFRGDTMKFDLAFTRGALPINLTGASIWFTARLTKFHPDVLFERTIDNGGIVVTNALGGLARLIIRPEDTEEIPIPDSDSITLACDIQLQEANEEVDTPADGTLKLFLDITQERNP